MREAAEHPVLSVHAGPETRLVHDGSIVRLDLKQSSLFSFGLEQDLRFDPSMWRHIGRVTETVKWFSPDVLHFTGPSDVGQLGACVGHRLNIPMVASWHTNLHEYASRRLRLKWLGQARRDDAKTWVEQQALRLLMWFYRIPRVVLAPNVELAEILEAGTGKPAFLMSRGVNTDVFTPARRRGPNAIVNIGYVGRLSAEKDVRLLPQIESELDAEGLDVRFTIVGEGSEREWLRRRMMRAQFTGVLRGEALADAYAQMDIFAFPSETDTVGNVVLEAMASGVPAVVMAAGGQRFMVDAESNRDRRRYSLKLSSKAYERSSRTAGAARRWASPRERSRSSCSRGIASSSTSATLVRDRLSPQPKARAITGACCRRRRGACLHALTALKISTVVSADRLACLRPHLDSNRGRPSLRWSPRSDSSRAAHAFSIRLAVSSPATRMLSTRPAPSILAP